MNEKKTMRSRRIGGLITMFATLILVMLMALPSWAATFTIDIPSEVIRGDAGERVPLRTEITPETLVGQTCSVTATGNNNESVHLGNDIEIVSGNTVTLFGVEDEPNKTTAGDALLSLTDTITITLILGDEDGVYSAGLSILLECNAVTTTTEPPEEPTTTLPEEPTTTLTDEVTTTTGSIVVTTTSTVPTEVGGIVVTTTTTNDGGDEVEGTGVLPLTGTNSGPMMLVATVALALGAGLVVATRRDET